MDTVFMAIERAALLKRVVHSDFSPTLATPIAMTPMRPTGTGALSRLRYHSRLDRPYGFGCAGPLGTTFFASVRDLPLSIDEVNGPNKNRDHFDTTMSAYRWSLRLGQ